MMRCIACGRLPTESCCESCHRAARLSTFGDKEPSDQAPPYQRMGRRQGFVITRHGLKAVVD